MRPGEGTNVSGFSALMRHSMAWPRNSIGPGRHLVQRLALRDADLALDDVDAGDEFRHRMLHLDARVDLDEVELAVLRPSGTPPCPRWCSPRPTAPSAVPRPISARMRVRHHRRGRFLQQLLMPPLDAAFALAQNLDVAVLVGQHLEFDVARRADELLQVDVGRTERRAGLAAAPARRAAAALRRLVDHAHAASAAARGSLQNHRIADLAPPAPALLPAT